MPPPTVTTLLAQLARSVALDAAARLAQLKARRYV